MRRLYSCSLGVPLAITGTALLGLTPMINSASAYDDRLMGAAAATDPDIGLIMGGSDEPIPVPTSSMLSIASTSNLIFREPSTPER
jgi:hypothetical protein